MLHFIMRTMYMQAFIYYVNNTYYPNLLYEYFDASLNILMPLFYMLK